MWYAKTICKERDHVQTSMEFIPLSKNSVTPICIAFQQHWRKISGPEQV